MSPSRIIISARMNITVLFEQQEATISPKPKATATAPLKDLPLYIKHRLSHDYITASLADPCMSPIKKAHQSEKPIDAPLLFIKHQMEIVLAIL